MADEEGSGLFLFDHGTPGSGLSGAYWGRSEDGDRRGILTLTEIRTQTCALLLNTSDLVDTPIGVHCDVIKTHPDGSLILRDVEPPSERYPLEKGRTYTCHLVRLGYGYHGPVDAVCRVRGFPAYVHVPLDGSMHPELIYAIITNVGFDPRDWTTLPRDAVFEAYGHAFEVLVADVRGPCVGFVAE